jgi:hypothetical protein
LVFRDDREAKTAALKAAALRRTKSADLQGEAAATKPICLLLFLLYLRVELHAAESIS